MIQAIGADPRWYEKYDGVSWFDEAWRDPWVYPDPDGDGWHMPTGMTVKGTLGA